MTTASLAAIASDPDAFEAFYRAHVDDVQSYVARRVDDAATAADLTADVFLAVVARAHTHDPALGSARMWVFGIARSVVAGERRRSARHARAVSRVSGRRLMQGDAYDAVVGRLDAEREARVLHRRLEQLPRALREVMELVGLDGLDVGEAAAVLGIRPGTARVRLHRARRLLSGPPDPPAPAIDSASAPTPVRSGR
ncbi:RNA polymerase sigma factor [Nocardioides marmoraquaticus]